MPTPHPSQPKPRLKLGLFIGTGEGMLPNGKSQRWDDIQALAEQAEAVGFDSIWVHDRFMQVGEIGVWESYSLIAALAAVTQRVEIGNLVTWFGYRTPALLAKMVDTIDEISNGRLVLGLGARSRKDEEPRRYGYHFGREEYFSRFAEAVQVIHGLLRHGQIDFDGKFYQLHNAVLRPRGPRPQGPRILIGARGPKMMELVARYADEWNDSLLFTRSHPDELATGLQRLEAACHTVGRDPATVARSALIVADAVHTPATLPAGHPFGPPIMGSTDEITQALLGFWDQGITHLQIAVTPQSSQGIEAFAPVIQAIQRATAQHPE